MWINLIFSLCLISGTAIAQSVEETETDSSSPAVESGLNSADSAEPVSATTEAATAVAASEEANSNAEADNVTAASSEESIEVLSSPGDVELLFDPSEEISEDLSVSFPADI